MKIFRILFGLLFLCLLLAVGLWYGSDSIARKAITTAGTKALGVETKLDDVSIGWFSGKLSLAGLEIANPEGFSDKAFFQMEEARLDVDLPTLLANEVVVSLFSLKGIRLSLETQGTSTNYGALLDALDSGDGGGAKKSGGGDSKGGKSSGGGGSEKTYAIDRIVLEDIQVSVDLGTSLVSTGGTVDVPRIELNDLSSKKLTLKELSALILRTLIERAATSGQDLFPKDILDRLHVSAEGFADLKGLGEIQSLEDAKELKEKVEKAGRDAKGALRGLLGKD